MDRKKFKYYQTDEFKELQQEWYGVLKTEGFDDIEQIDTPYVERPFKHKRTTVDLDYETKAQYFQMASAYYWHGEFLKPHHKQIWSLHAEGATVREIATKLKMWPNSVQRVLKKYKKRMLNK